MPKQLLNARPLAKPRILKAPRQVPASALIPDIREFKSLASELRSLMPWRDGAGALQFRILHYGERPLNRFARRLIARRLVTGQYK